MPDVVTAESAAEATGQQLSPAAIAEQNWHRYQYCKRRGHQNYVYHAARCEGFYLGGGLQWSSAAAAKIIESKRMPVEFNGIMPAINGAVGYQIQNRMDISFLPRGGDADNDLAKVRSKVAMQVLDQNKFHWSETQVFSDGLIEQRGFYDVRMNFNTNVFGDIDISVLDPRDVVIDADAKSYTPDEWYDVTVTRWYNADEVEQFYGRAARLLLQPFVDAEGDWGELDDDGPRNKIGDEGPSAQTWDAFADDIDAKKFRILDRQRWVYQLCQVAVYPTGDVKDVSEALPEQLDEYTRQGAVITKRMHRKVRWTVSTRFTVLHDSISPYDRLTVVPYFCYFRRGKTRGMVDNAISPQEVLNKAASQFVHILNSMANSGWIVQENSLVNMQATDLEDDGSKTGLILEYKKGFDKPEKIQPNQIPAGMDRLMDLAHTALKNVTVQDAMLGLEKQAISGVAIQSKQFAQQNQIAIPLDNLARTRHMIADFVNYLITNYYDNRRIFRIAETDPLTGKDVTQTYHVNVYDQATGLWSNDLTEGDYDVVVSERPMQVTFNNSEFEQVMEMRKQGVRIPDAEVIHSSNLSRKGEIIDQITNSAPPPQSPLDEAKTASEKAKAEKLAADTAFVRSQSQYANVETGQVLAQVPAIGIIADALARSAGVQDMDAPPLIPTPATGLLPAGPAAPIAAPGARNDTTPLTPPSAVPGINGGGP